MENLPLFTEPVMVCGLDISKKPDQTTLSLIYSTDTKGAKYSHEFELIKTDGSNYIDKLKSAFTNAFNAFKEINKVFPK